MGNNIKVDYSYYEDYNTAALEYDEQNNSYYIQNFSFSNYNGFDTKLIKLVISDLKEKELYNYSYLFDTKLTVTASKKVIEKLKETEQENHDAYYENQTNEVINGYEETINEYSQQINDYMNSEYEYQNQISDLEMQIEELEQRIEQYKSDLQNIIED
jgi:chromosome segregation ATPase